MAKTTKIGETTFIFLGGGGGERVRRNLLDARKKILEQAKLQKKKFLYCFLQ